jgi:hypothetical protein
MLLEKIFLTGIFTSLLLQAAHPNELRKEEFKAETYSTEGKTVGCGISFFLLWQTDEQEMAGAGGSITYFQPNFADAGSAIKLTGAINFEKTKLTYAWFEIDGYGDTKRFSKQASSDHASYVANLKPDNRGTFLPVLAVTKGFRVGLHFHDRPLDEILVVPPVLDVSVTRDLQSCLRSLKPHE